MYRLGLLFLLGVTGFVYGAVAGHDYIVVDDPAYVIMNPWVNEGLTGPGVAWAFTSLHAFNWHPLTWLSHMADVEFLGPDPAGPHLVSAALHLVATALLFFALRRLGGRDAESLAVAAIFALHPMHVESVAWVSERKDVLSACFSFLALWTWAWYAARPGLGRYLLVTLWVAAALLSKPMAVTLPLILWLLDVWPLGRAGWTQGRRLGMLLLEKVPLLLLAAGVGLLTLAAQQPGVENSAETLPLFARLGNALVAYERYLAFAVWPVGLSAFYPHPGWLPLPRVLLAAAILLAISVLALRERNRRPYLLMGWLWFLGTLVPVIGLLQVGDQSMADRYTYVPYVGLSVMVVWTLGDLVRMGRLPRVAVIAASCVALALFASAARARVADWRNTETLYEAALVATGPNAFAHFVLATVLLLEERNEEATTHLRATVEVEPDHAEALNGLGAAALREGREDEALQLFRRAADLASWHFEAQFNAGNLLDSRGEASAALPYLEKAARLEPNLAAVQVRLGGVLEALGRNRVAGAHYRRALALEPDLAEARDGMRRIRAARSRRPGSAGGGPPARPPAASVEPRGF